MITYTWLKFDAVYSQTLSVQKARGDDLHHVRLRPLHNPIVYTSHPGIHLSDIKNKHVYIPSRKKIAYKCCQWLMVITCHEGADEFIGYNCRDSPEPIKESVNKRPDDIKVLKWQTQLLSKLPVCMLRNSGFGFYSNLILVVGLTYTLETSVEWTPSWYLFDQHFVSTYY